MTDVQNTMNDIKKMTNFHASDNPLTAMPTIFEEQFLSERVQFDLMMMSRDDRQNLYSEMKSNTHPDVPYGYVDDHTISFFAPSDMGPNFTLASDGDYKRTAL